MKVAAEEKAATDPVNERVREVITRTFKVGAGNSNGDLRMGGVPGWDSLGHMRLVVELEEEFEVSIATFLVGQLVDVDSIAGTIRELQAEE